MSLVCKFNDLPDDEFNVEFQASGHIVTLTSADGRKLPQDNSGFYITREDHYDNWDYSDYATVYRMLDNGLTLQLSNDGSVYVPPTKDVTFQIVWNDGDNIYQVRPESVEITVYKNGKKSVVRTLNESNNWEYRVKDKPIEDVFTMTCDDVDRYVKSIDGTTATYFLAIPEPREITSEDVNETILEMAEGKPLTYIKNMYASYCEKNLKNFNTDVPDPMKAEVRDVITSDLFMVNEDGTTSLIPINVD